MMFVNRYNNLIKDFLNKTTYACPQATKHLWSYGAVAFNRVDIDRLKVVGPDRLCAEWVLKNDPHRPIKDYNRLPLEPDNKFRIKIVDGSGSSIMKIGLEHFKDCNHIDTLKFHQCKHLESDGLDGIVHLRRTLKALQVSECDNISDYGILVIELMNHLEMLRIFDMRFVKNIEKVKTKITNSLPNCLVDINN